MNARLTGFVIGLVILAAADASAQTPFTGTPVPLPGTVQAEDFDNGGENVAYHDTTSSNQGKQYRNTRVDIGTSYDTGGGYHVGYTRVGEWLVYTVNVTTAGPYELQFRLANNAVGGRFHLEVDGVNVTGQLAVPNTGGYQIWQTVTKSGVALSAGQHRLRLVFEATSVNNAAGNLNWIRAVAQVQIPCSYVVTPTNLGTFPYGGGIGTVSVTTQSGCGWTASSNQPWAPVTPTSATGSGSVSVTVAANSAEATRSATVTVAGQAVSVTQAAAPPPPPPPPPPPTGTLCDDPVQAAQTMLRGTATNLLICHEGPTPTGFKVVVRQTVYPWSDIITDLGPLTPAGAPNAAGLTPYYLPLALQAPGLFGISSIAYNWNATDGWAQTNSSNEIMVTVQ